MSIPIVLTAFGTSTRARQTYHRIDERVKGRFPDQAVHWAFTSRMVKSKIRQEDGLELKHPDQVLAELQDNGHDWAVVQSLHLVCGHEFQRLVCELCSCQLRTSIGLPLLDQPHDYRAVAQALETELGPGDPDEPLVLVGHGTDHAAWAAYPALEQVAGRIMSRSVFVGTVEGEPSPEEVVDRVIREGFKRVCLMPFLLVAGVHFQEDLCGEEDSWKALFESRGVEVRLEPRGLGQLDAMLDIFCRHIAEALEVIPSQG